MLTHPALVAGEPGAPEEATLTSSPRNLSGAKLQAGSWKCSRPGKTPTFWEVVGRAAWKQGTEGSGENLCLYPQLTYTIKAEGKGDTENLETLYFPNYFVLPAFL